LTWLIGVCFFLRFLPSPRIAPCAGTDLKPQLNSA
jgi:hypothetical protein